MNKEEQLKEDFDVALNHMISEWETNAKKAKEFSDFETVKNEHIKCNIIKAVKSIYKVKYNQVYGGK